MDKITFITGNAGKAEEVSRYLGFPVDHVALELDEIQSLDLEAVVRDKAMRAYDAMKKPVLVEDVSLVFRAFGKLPGPLIRWFLEELGNEGLCRLLDGKEDRFCVATVCYGFSDGNTVRLVSGSMEGSVADHPRGSNSFGWAAMFVPAGMGRTYAELTNDEQAPIAMRRKALEELRDLIGRVGTKA
jgi:non-canonical purine NTP pyrophosphatase (RdgB/HAM1 family)